jgi:ElaB/YqjD/DUF883 family membrane-anchored ribosome-binding protein
MTAKEQNLPEGTDSIIAGAGVNDADESTIGSETPAGADIKDEVFGRYESLRGQAGDKAREFALVGKDRATAALDDMVRMIEDAAGEVDARIGSQYGDYARRAAQGLGDFSESFKGKDVDELFEDARALIQKSPAAAVGIAAALGFVVARLARSGLSDSTGDTKA